MSDLDRTDRDILTILAQDARVTNKELARRVGLSESGCLERVRRLRDSNTLRGAHSEVAPEAFGVHVEAFIAVTLSRHTRKAITAFERKTFALPQVMAIHHLTGRTDFLVHVVSSDMDHLRDFTMDAITGLPEVARVETSLVFGSHRKWSWPDLTV